MPPTAGTFRFGDHELDVATRELRGPDGPTVLEPQVFDVLAHLVVNCDRVVPKLELLDEVWGDRFVSDSALSSRIKSARRAVGDDGRQQRLIRTIHGVGFRFVAPVEPIRAPGEATTTGPDPGEAPPPPPVEPLIGREAELADLAAALTDHRLVTLVGPGGIGKTHLLRHGIAGLATGVDGWARLVDLSSVPDGAAIGPNVAAAVAAPRLADATTDEAIVHHLRSQRMLLAIDNAEHVRDDAANLLAAVLASAPEVRIVVTSRERLGIDGERLVPVGPLDLDDAVRLFVHRAAANAAHLDPTDPSLRALCRRLDGIPLAIRLAAARTPALSVSEILVRLGEHLRSDAVPIDSPERHADMQRALEWSLRSLDPDDRVALAALSILRGSFDLDDASAVIGHDALDVVLRLVERSLVVPQRTEDASRFRVLEPVRLVVRRFREPEVPARFVHHVAARTTAAARRVESPELDEGIDRFRRIWASTRVAIRFALDLDDRAAATTIVLDAAAVAEAKLLTEVIDWALAAAEIRPLSTAGIVPGVAMAGAEPPSLDDPDQADLVAVAARLLLHRGRRDLADPLLAALEPWPASIHVSQTRVWQAWSRGDLAGLDHQLRQVEDLVRHTGGLTELGMRALRVSERAFAERPDAAVTAELRALAVRSGDTGRPFELMADAVDHLWNERYDRALEVFDLGVEEARTSRLSLVATGLASYRSIVVANLGDDDRAVERLVAALGDALLTGSMAVALSDLAVAAQILADRGEPAAAARILGVRHAADHQAATTERMAARLRARLATDDEAGFRREFEAGRWLPLEEAVERAVDGLERLLRR
ncbi:MAG: winged helix-turn-helix domain-containing protein [Actinomycetota bacterium]